VNAYFPYFLFFPDDAPPPASSSSSPASRTTSLHRHASLRPVATEVRTPVFPLLWTPRPSSRGRTPVAPRRRAVAGDAGHRARMGRVFLLVPLPSPMRARRLPSLAPLAVGSHPVLAAAVARCRRVRVRVRASRDALAQACTPTRARRSPGGEAGPLAPSLAPDLQFASLSSAPPWPRHGGLPRAHARRGESAALLTGECALRHRPPFTRDGAQLRSSCPPPPMAPA
jgi:hypothetical protein